MIGKMILALILVMIIVVIWHVFTLCKTGDGGMFTWMFANICHVFYRTRKHAVREKSKR